MLTFIPVFAESVLASELFDLLILLLPAFFAYESTLDEFLATSLAFLRHHQDLPSVR